MGAQWLHQKYVHEGMSASKLAKCCGCCKATMLKQLHKNNIPLRAKGVRKTALTKAILLDLYVKKKCSARDIARKMGCGQTTVLRHLKRQGICARDISVSHIKYVRTAFSGDLAQKAYLIGFAIGDLRIRKIGRNSTTIKADCGSTKKEQITLIQSLFHRYGHVWISKTYALGRMQIEAFLDESFTFLLTAREDLIVFLKNNDCFFPFLAGFSDAEGCFGITRNRAYYSLGNYDKELLEIIMQELSRRGIIVSGLYSDNKLYISSDGYRRNNYYHHLRIARKDALSRFIVCLEPFVRHEGKKRRLELVKQNLLERQK